MKCYHKYIALLKITERIKLVSRQTFLELLSPLKLYISLRDMLYGFKEFFTRILSLFTQTRCICSNVHCVIKIIEVDLSHNFEVQSLKIFNFILIAGVTMTILFDCLPSE